MNSLQLNQIVWCDKCTNAVTTVDGEESNGNCVVCPTCKTGFYLETL